MVRFPGSGRSCAVLAILMILAAGCATGRAHAAPAGQPRSPRPRPAPSATGIVKRADTLTGVTCLPAGTCVAVGWYYSGATTSTQTLAIRWNGRTWQGERVPRPAPVPQTLTVAAVSCATARFCMAVGDASRGAKAMPSPAYRDTTLAERWNGSRWHIVPAPSPTHASVFSGVSCPSPTVCVAVGSSANGARTLAERWNGLRWTVQRTPNIGHIGYSALTAVSCAAAANCMAVGTYNAGIFGIAEHWDGSRWTVQRLPVLPVPPVPPGEEPLVLPVSVSCVRHGLCDGGQQPDGDNGRALERHHVGRPGDPEPRLTGSARVPVPLR